MHLADLGNRFIDVVPGLLFRTQEKAAVAEGIHMGGSGWHDGEGWVTGTVTELSDGTPSWRRERGVGSRQPPEP